MSLDIRHTEIRLDGHRGTVVIGGHDLSPAIYGFTLRAAADQIPELELDLVAPTAEVTGEAEVRVFLPDATRKALIALGWTPPPDQDSDTDEADAA